MRKNDMKPVDLLLALVLLTRLPLPHLSKESFSRQARATWAFPVAGLMVGGMASLVGMIALNFWPPIIAAGLALTLQVVVTGAMHEDGLADTADGFWGGFERARRLEIMKDSHIGSYGVLALILGIGLRWAALTALFDAGLIWAPVALGVLSRAAMPVLMASLPNARGQGLSQSVGRPAGGTVLTGLTLAMVLAVLAIGWGALPAALLAAPVVLALRALAKAKIGGQTGDVLGATQQVSELSLALALLALT